MQINIHRDPDNRHSEGENLQYYPQNYSNYGPLLTITHREQSLRNEPQMLCPAQETIKNQKSKRSQLVTQTLAVVFLQKMIKYKQRKNATTPRHFNFISDISSDSAKFFTTRISNSFASFHIPNEWISFILRLQQSFKGKINIIESFIENVLTNIQLLHPNSNSKFIWDIIVFIVRIILLVIVPLDIGFQTGILFNSEYGITIFINVIIQLDFLVRSCTIVVYFILYLVNNQKDHGFKIDIYQINPQICNIQNLFISQLLQCQQQGMVIICHIIVLKRLSHVYSLYSHHYGILTVLTLLVVLSTILHKIREKGIRKLEQSINTLTSMMCPIPYNISNLQFINRIKQYLNYRWIEDEEVDINMEQQLLNQLSDDLKQQLNNQIYDKFTKEADFFFKCFSQEFKQQLKNKIKRRLLKPFDLFTIEFDGTNNLCFLEYGDVTLKDQFVKGKSQFLYNQKKGKFIQIQNFITDKKDLDTFQATSHVSLLTLSKQDFLSAVKNKSVDYQYYCEIRDSILFDKDHDKLLNEVYCNACKSNDHKLKECKFTHFIPDRESIIKRHSWSHQQNQSKYVRGEFKRSTFIPLEQRKKLIHSEQRQKIDLESMNEFITNINQLEIAALKTQQNYPIQVNLQQTLLGETCGDFDESQSEPDDDIIQSLNEHQNIKTSQPQNLVHSSQKSQFARHEIKPNRPKPIMTDKTDNIDFEMQSLKPPQLFKMQSEQKKKNLIKVPNNNSNQLIPITESASKISSNKFITPEKYIVLLTIEHNNQKLIIQEFNQQFQQRLCMIYENLKEKIENHQSKQYYQDVEFQYLRINQKYFDDFDVFQNFSIYKVNNNMPYINDQKGRRFHWQQKYINRFIKYMFTPYDYINTFLNESFIQLQKQTFKLRQTVQKIRNIIFMQSIAKKKRQLQKKLTRRIQMRTIIYHK